MIDEPTAVGRAIFRAALHLPEHWAVRVELERSAGTVSLIDPSGYAHWIDGAGELFSEQINAAIDRAAAGRHLTQKSPARFSGSAWIDGLAVRPMKARRLTRI